MEVDALIPPGIDGGCPRLAGLEIVTAAGVGGSTTLRPSRGHSLRPRLRFIKLGENEGEFHPLDALYPHPIITSLRYLVRQIVIYVSRIVILRGLAVVNTFFL